MLNVDKGYFFFLPYGPLAADGAWHKDLPVRLSPWALDPM